MLFVLVILPSFISCVSVMIHSWVELLASGWGAMRHLPLVMCDPGFVVSVINSPGFIQVLEDGACSRMRLLIILVSVVVIALACGVSMAFAALLVM